MTKCTIDSYGEGLLMVRAQVDPDGKIIRFGADAHGWFVGCTVIDAQGRTYDYQVIDVGIPGLFGIDRWVSFAVPAAQLQNGKVYAAVWEGEPIRGVDNGAKLLSMDERSGNDLLAYQFNIPIADIGDAVKNTVVNVAESAEGASGIIKGVASDPVLLFGAIIAGVFILSKVR